MNINGGAFVFPSAGAIPMRRSGLVQRSARGLRAEQSSIGVSREAGRASCLLGHKRRKGSHRLIKIQERGHAFGPRSPRKRKLTEVSSAEFNAKAQETDRGSLSISIVAIESRVTIPREPASSQGRCRV